MRYCSSSEHIVATAFYDQIRQVYSVTGSRMLLSRRSEMPGMPVHLRRPELRAGSWMDLSVVYFSMGWYGENIGPKEARFDLL